MDILAYEGIMNQHTTANITHRANARGVPTPAYSSAIFFSPTPSLAAITVFMPTPVPTASAIISSCSGYTIDRAVRPVSEYLPTKRLSTILYKA